MTKITPTTTSFERLSEYFTPHAYSLHLNIARLTRRFTGRVVISGTRTSLKAPIKLHAKELEISGVVINNIPTQIQKGKNDQITLIPSSGLTTKEIIITLDFAGDITNPMHGMYPCFFEFNGEKKELIATQFESHYAREVFPCVDEPGVKATFDVSLETEKNVTVLGNMPIKKQVSHSDTLLTTFQTTPKMSTYLLAFIIGEIHNVSGHTKDGIEVNIWSTRAQSRESLAFALDVSIRSIEFFSDYFGTPYPLPKLDHVCLPDFSVGGMENWGLVTYREVVLVVDPKNASITTKQRSAEVITHETSHQWFGNLVTMEWWDDLWLNESFANLMEYLAVDALFPQWNSWLEFAAGESIMAVRRDSLPGVQAVKVSLSHPDEIHTILDPAIVYAKGGQILHMLRYFIGEEAFQNGLKKYFKRHAYKNTVGADLWQSLSESSGQDLSLFMNQWLEQSGLPVVSASIKNSQLHLTQKQFVIGSQPDSKKLWPIPLNLVGGNSVGLFNTPYTDIPLPKGEYLKLNPGDNGHFVTDYGKELFTRLIKAVETGQLNEIDRLQLIHEASLLTRALLKPTIELIELLASYKNESSYAVWGLLSLTIGDLKRFVENDAQAENGLKQLVRSLTHQLYEELGWRVQKNEIDSTTKLRTIIISLMLYAEDNSAIAHAYSAYKNVSNIAELDAELRPNILASVVRHDAGSDLIDKLISLYSTTHSSDLQHDICSGLTSTRDEVVIAKLLSLLKKTEIVRPQDLPYWFAYLIRNRYARAATWQWMKDNWVWIKATFKGDLHYDIFARYSANSFNTRAELKEFQNFFKPKLNEVSLRRNIEIGLEEISGRITWLEKDQAAVIKKLKTFL